MKKKNFKFIDGYDGKKNESPSARNLRRKLKIKEETIPVDVPNQFASAFTMSVEFRYSG